MKKAACLIIFLLAFSLRVNAVFAYIPNDPLISKQWYLEKTNVFNAWDITKGSPDVIVAIIDSGVDIDHIDLKDNIWVNKGEIPNNGIDDDHNGYVDDTYGWDFVNGDNDPNPDIDVSCIAEKKCSLEGVNHGTVIAGIIAAKQDNNEGISGIAPNVKVMALKVLNPNGGGNIEDVIKAIEYAKSMGASIINMSFVGNNDSVYLEKVMEEAAKSNIIFTVAAGNNVDGGVDLNMNPMYPVCSKFDSRVIFGISATDKNNIKPYFANSGSDCIEFSAPGTSIFSTTVYKGEHSSFNNYYNGYWSGTSVSTPIISSAIALIKSINSSLNNEEIYNILFDNSYDLNDTSIGRGVDIYKSVKYALDNYTIIPSDTFQIIASSGVGGEPNVSIFKSDGTLEKTFLAYTKNFKGGVNSMMADFNGDFEKEIVTSPFSNGGPHIRVFSEEGILQSEFFAYPKNMLSGVNLAPIDSDSDGEFEIVTAPSKNYQPEIKIFDKSGKLKTSFLAYAKSFKGGVNIASCDLNGDEDYSIVTAPASSGASHIRIFDSKGKVKKEFFAYNKKITGGFSISCSDINNDTKDEIVILNKSGDSISLDVFNGEGKNIKKISLGNGFNLKNYNLSFINSDIGYHKKIIISPKGSGSPEIKIFDISGKFLTKFYINNKNLNGGVNIAIKK